MLMDYSTCLYYASFQELKSPNQSFAVLITNIYPGVLLIFKQSGNHAHMLAPHCGSAADDNLKTQTNKLEFSDLTLRFIQKGSSLCTNPFKGFTLWSESFEGLKGVGLKCLSASLSCAHTEVPSSWKASVQRIMGARSIHQLSPSKSFIPNGPFKVASY